MRLGCRAHDFGCRTPEELAAAISAQGITCVQLAPAKAFPGIAWRTGELPPAIAERAANAFNACGIEIAVLGCYVNPIHPDPVQRKVLLDIFKEHLKVARAFGCQVVALETGSLNADYSPHPDNHTESAFQKLVASLSELVEVAEEAGVKVGVEVVTSHTVHSPPLMRRLLEVIASDHIGVIFDPVNYLHEANWQRQSAIFKEALDLYGDRILALHIKDFTVDEAGIKPQALGKGGLLNAEEVFAWMAREKQDHPILLEEVDEATVGTSLSALQDARAVFSHQSSNVIGDRDL